MNINHTRNLNRLANAYYDNDTMTTTTTTTTEQEQKQRQDDLNHVALCTWSFVRSMKRHLSPNEEDEDDFVQEMYDKLVPEQAAKVIASKHRPNRALQDLSYSIEELPMHYLRKHEIQRAITIFEDNLGSSERILTSPVPLFYSRHLSRFLVVWLLLLPFGLYDSFATSWNHITMIPATVIISTMLFGIEEIGTQLEEPFTVLPMQAFCDKIYNWCIEIQSWTPGDNGRSQPLMQPQHVYYTTTTPGTGTTTTINGATTTGTTTVATTPTPGPPTPPPLAPMNGHSTHNDMTTSTTTTTTATASHKDISQQLSMEEFLKRQTQEY